MNTECHDLRFLAPWKWKSLHKKRIIYTKTVSHSWDISLTVTLPRHKLHLVPKDYNSGPQRHIFSLFLFDRKNNSLGRTH